MSNRKLWTEQIIGLFRIGVERDRLSLVLRLVRSLCLLSIFWLTGLATILIDSARSPYPFTFLLSWLMGNMTETSILFFGVFVVSGWYSDKWNWFFDWSSHMLRLSEPEFRKFRDRLERIITSFIPCLVLALVLFISYITPNLEALPASLMYVSTYWWGCTSFMLMLLLGTSIWLVISMWIGVFFTFRQPLNIKLSRWTSRDFRPLAIWSLKASLLYFAGVAIVSIFFFIQGYLWGTTLFVASTSLSVFIGVMAFLMPFYNIHRTLVKLKERQLQEIEDESNKLIEELTKTLVKYHASDSKEYIMLIMSRLVNLNILQIKERNVTEADEWPIDTTILSIFSAIVLTPILTHIIIEILYGVFMV